MNCANRSNASYSDSKYLEKTPNTQKFVSEITQFEREINDVSQRENNDVIQILPKKFPDTNIIYSNNPANIAEVNSKEKKIILKKYDSQLYEILKKNTRRKDFISNELFETKVTNLRSCLEEIKIDWREAHCNLNISRENMLEDTLKKIGSTDPYKVLFLNTIRNLKFTLKEKLVMMQVELSENGLLFYSKNYFLLIWVKFFRDFS